MASWRSSGASYTCASCGASGPTVTALCAQCQTTRYCNRECQKAHWKAHKKECIPKSVYIAAGAPASSATATASKPKPKTKSAPLTEDVAFAAASSSASAGTDSAAADDAKAPTIAQLIAESGHTSSHPSASSGPAQPIAAITFSLPDAAAPSHPLLRIAELPGKGRGFVATESIEPGTLLLTEQSVYAHSEGVGSHEGQRIATLVALTKVMHEKYPAALERLCHHPEHELPQHPSIDTAPDGMELEAWHTALARVDSNQFTSNRGMMVSPTVSMCNHSCYPNADLIIREVKHDGRTVEQVHINAIQSIAAGEEVNINYLGSDSLCRWYAPSMIRQESFRAQWQFTCTCLRCTKGPKSNAIDKTLTYAPDIMDEELEQRYTQLVLAESDSAPSPEKLLGLYRDLFTQFSGDQFSHHYLLHQLRTMLIFMPAAFDERAAIPTTKEKPAVKGKSASASSVPAHLTGAAEWLQLVEHHLRTLAGHLLNPPLHSIKSDTILVLLKSCDYIGSEYADKNRNAKDEASVVRNIALRKQVIALADEADATYFENPTFAQMYPEAYAQLNEFGRPE